MIAVAILATASGTYARMSVPEPEPSPTPVIRTFIPTDLVGCDGAEPGWPRGDLSEHACRVLGIPPSGAQPATWRLDPSYSFLASSREVHVLVRSEASCPAEIGGEDLAVTGLVDQDVRYSGARVVVTLQLWWPMVRGWGLCDASQTYDRAWLPYVLELPEAVGDRDLVDGEPDPMTLIHAR